MSDTFLQFGILGLGAGAVYGLVALGVVLVYRGSGIVNFAAGAIGMVGAFIFYDQRASGTPTVLCWVYALLFAVVTGAVIHLVIMRSLRHAPALTRVIATLGIFTLLYSWAEQRYGDTPQIVSKILPYRDIEVLPGNVLGEDRLILLGIGIVLTCVFTIVWRRSKFGLATSAVAESRQIISSQGISPDLIATVNWMVGSCLAVAGAILIVDITGLSVDGLALLVIPALAAALVGSFRSFSLTFIGALMIGIIESEVNWFQYYLTVHLRRPITLDGWAESIPLLVIVLVLVLRGRALPIRGDSVGEPPEVGTGAVSRVPVLIAVIGTVLVSIFLSPNMLQALTTSLAIAAILLSLVVVTGMAGQLSLAQFGLAGIGAWVCAELVAQHGWPFGLAALAGIACTVPVGLLVGLPSLRARGINLAIVTLALALVIEVQIFDNSNLTGGVSGLDIGSPSLFGINIGPLQHPLGYALFSLACVIALCLVVATVRRGRVGRRLVAVRSNERAAASLGISVFGAKLYAFGLGSAIAAVGGILLLFEQENAVFIPTFSALQSVFGVVSAVVGGIGFVLGGIIGGLQYPGGFVPEGLGSVIPAFQTNNTVQLVLAAGLLVVLWRMPNGIAALPWRSRWIGKRISRLNVMRPRARVEQLPEAVLERVAPATLELKDVGVRYGGVVALDGVSLSVKPGQVVGLIGPNGAGKTTLIDAVTGFTTARGQIQLGDVPITGWSARRRARAGLARSFQSLELFETMTVRENLRTAADPRDRHSYLTGLVHAGRAPLPASAVAAVRQFDLEDVLDRRPDELSQGKRRLVAIARAVAAKPSVLLLDEPAAGLDDNETRELGELIRNLAEMWGMGILLVEHDVSLVVSVCDQIVVLDCGRQLASGSPAEIVQNDAVVAAYLGVSVEGSTSELPASRPAGPHRSGDGGGPLVNVRGLSAGYGDVEVLHDVDITVQPGEIVAVLGPNGAGKTTLLLSIAGEIPSVRGEVSVLGLSRSSPLHRRARAGLSMVPDDRGIVSSLTCEGNLRLGPGLVSDSVAEFPEIAPLMRRRAGLLSGGEQQMIALGRALSAKPRLLMVDELSLGLAPLLVERLLLSIRKAADNGVGVLLVEQHAVEALRIADRGIVLRRGRVELEGDAATLLVRLNEIEDAYLGEPHEARGIQFQ